MLKKLTRFAVTGILNTGLDILILNILFVIWPPHGQNVMIAWENCLAFAVGAIQSFLLNKFWTFKDKSPITFQQVLKFAGVTGGNMILNTLILEALIMILGVSPDGAGLTAVALKAGVATIMMVVSFCGMLLIVFVGLKKEGDELVMPDNTYIPYQPYHHSLTVVLPAYNEEQNIAKTLSDTLSLLPRLVRDYEIIVVNDGSKDRTAEQVKYIMAMSKSVRLVNHTVNQGYGAALVSGFEAATKELTMFMDSDGQFSIISLARMLPHIDEVDAVFGYRIKRQDTWMRKLNARCWKFLVYTVFGVNLHDLDCAFKVMRTRFLHEHPLETRGAMINAELVYKFLRAGMSYQEVGVHHYSRVTGVATGAKPRVILKALKDVCVYASKWAREEQKIAA